MFLVVEFKFNSPKYEYSFDEKTINWVGEQMFFRFPNGFTAVITKFNRFFGIFGTYEIKVKCNKPIENFDELKNVPGLAQAPLRFSNPYLINAFLKEVAEF